MDSFDVQAGLIGLMGPIGPIGFIIRSIQATVSAGLAIYDFTFYRPSGAY
ncbi:MAG: hypothetical protein RIR86_2002, partial [Acidobacteriota bacterium]